MVGENVSRTNSDVKKIRMSEWQSMVEREIQKLMVEAAKLRKIMNEAKTTPKREYYNKKFEKISNEAIKLVGILQSITAKQSTLDPTTTLNLTPAHDQDLPNTAV